MLSCEATCDAGGGPHLQYPSDAQPPPTPPQSLSDMPASWLFQLLEAIGSWELPLEYQRETRRDELLQLFRVCRTLRDLVLAQRTLLLRFHLPIPLRQAAAAEAKLVLACKRSSKVTLRLTSLDWPAPAPTAADTEINASSLLWGAKKAMETAGFKDGLAAINTVKLSNLELSAFAPCWLASTCHNMSRVVHSATTLTLPPPTVGLVPAPQLRSLSLGVARYPMANQALAPCWQHQLRALPGLTSLDLDSWPELAARWMVEACSVVGSQLTQLAAGVRAADLPHLPAWYPCLRELQLSVTIDDQGVEVLLSMQLERLYVQRFQLQHSHAHRPCSWKHLDCWILDVSAFDRLPLEGVQIMAGCRDGSLTLVPSPGDLGATSRVAAAVARCGGIDTSQLNLANYEAHADSACLAATMAIAAGCSARLQTFLASEVPVTTELLAAIKQHLPTGTASEMVFNSCTFSCDVWPLLLPSFPAVHSLQINWDYEVGDRPTEAQITALCVHAQRPVELITGIGHTWQEGWEQRLQAAMAGAGHQHVKLIDHWRAQRG